MANLKSELKHKYYVFRESLDSYIEYSKMVLRSNLFRRKEKCLNKNLLLLVETFPPEITGGTYRPLSIVKYIPKLNWDISVIAPKNATNKTNAGNYLLKQIPREVTVLRISPPKEGFFPNIDGNFSQIITTFKTAKQNLQSTPPSVVMASGPTFDRFIAAFYLAKYFKAKLVLDYRDEWTENPFDFVQKGMFNRFWEKRCLKKADAVIFTTKSQIENQLKKFPQLKREKCHLIQNGWEPEEFRLKKATPTFPKNKIIISYIGNLGAMCLPQSFLENLEKINNRVLNKIELYLIGQKSGKALEGISKGSFKKLIRLVKQVEKPKANYLMKKSSALLLLNNKNFERYLPGKIFEYLAAGPPLLVYGQGGEIGRITEALKTGVIIRENNPKELEAAIIKIAKTKKISNPKKTNWLKEHTRENLAMKFVKVFNKIQGDSK